MYTRKQWQAKHRDFKPAWTLISGRSKHLIPFINNSWVKLKRHKTVEAPSPMKSHQTSYTTDFHCLIEQSQRKWYGKKIQREKPEALEASYEIINRPSKEISDALRKFMERDPTHGFARGLIIQRWSWVLRFHVDPPFSNNKFVALA